MVQTRFLTKAGSSKNDDSYIIHNTSTKNIKKPDYITELHQFKTKCGECKKIIQRVRSLLDEIRAIKENEIIGVCEHCKRVNQNKSCKRCDFIVSKFNALHKKKCEERQERFKVWLCKVKHLLQAILDSQSICQHRAYKDSELERFLKELKTPLSMRQPDIDFFPEFDSEQMMYLKSLSESKDMLEELLAKIQYQGEKRFSSDDSLYPSPSERTCLCKYLNERFDGKETLGLDTGESIDFSKLLCHDVFKELIKRLLDLSKALPEQLTLNDELIQKLIVTLNIAINQGLSTDIVIELIKELSELRNTITQDLSLDLNDEVIGGLIKDLNNLLTQGSSPDLQKDALQFLVGLTELLTHELSKNLTKEQSELLSKNIHKDVTLELSKTGQKDKGLKLSKNIEQVLSKDQIKDVKQQLPSQSKEKIQGSPKSQTKYSSKGFSSSHKEGSEGLHKDKNKEIEQDSPRRINREKSHGLPKTQSKDMTHAKSKDMDKEVSKGPQKEITQLKSKGLEKEIGQGPHKDVTKGKPKGLDKEIGQIVHKDITKGKSKVQDKEIGQGAHKEVTKGKSKGQDTERGQDPHKEVTKDKSKGQDTEIGQGPHKEVTPRLPKPKGQSKDGAQVLPKDTIKEKAPASPKDLNKETSTARRKERAPSLSKNANNQVVQKLQDSKNANTESLKDTSKTMPQGLSKDQNKKAAPGSSKDRGKVISQNTKDGNQDLSKDLKKIKSTKASKILSFGLSDKEPRPETKDASTKRKSDVPQYGFPFEHDASRAEQELEHKHDEPEEDIKRGTKPSRTLTGLTPKEERIKSSRKEKENLSPVDEMKKDYTAKEIVEEKKKRSSMVRKSLSMDKIKIIPKKSEALVLGMLQDNKDKPENYKLRQEKELERQREMAKKLESLTMKFLPQENIESPHVTSAVSSESIVVCDIGHSRPPKVMVRGNAIVPYDPRYKEVVDMPVEPLISKTPIIKQASTDKTHTLKKKPTSSRGDLTDGIIRYRLSDKEFIDKGWTKLPTKKIMRRMNIYRMQPASPQYDWFERHKEEKELFYDSGEKLADINENGRGRWYYRNGAIALDYYNAKESNTGQRYVVYSSGEEMEYGRIKPRTVLALFDILGNGVVYDHYGKVRLKYNQSEGLIVDAKLGPPGRWKWHTLNDPPVLQQVFVNTSLKQRDHNLELVSQAERAKDAINERHPHPEMLTIELDNFVKEKANKLLQKFKPFQIRMKAVKLNAQFALKILDQANIYLLFRDGTTSLKLNLGMLLISDEIIDTDTSDLTDVPTPYDRQPPKSDSVENIQRILKAVRTGKLHPTSELFDKA